MDAFAKGEKVELGEREIYAPADGGSWISTKKSGDELKDTLKKFHGNSNEEYNYYSDEEDDSKSYD